MKILSYNIHKCTQEKIDKVLAMNADIMILPECARYDHIKLPQDFSMKWTGDTAVSWKGLGVIWRNEHKAIIAPWHNCEHKYILPLIVDNQFILFATWPTLVPGGKQSYPQILFDALKEYEQYICSHPCIICGDFNCYIGQSRANKATGTFEQSIALLAKHNIYSLYHERSHEEFGKESRATYYHQLRKIHHSS